MSTSSKLNTVGQLCQLVLPCLPFPDEDIKSVIEAVLWDFLYRKIRPNPGFRPAEYWNGWAGTIRGMGHTRSEVVLVWDPVCVRFFEVVGKVLPGHGEMEDMPTEIAERMELRDAMCAFFTKMFGFK